MNLAVLVFPGSNETECVLAVERTIAQPATAVWHTEADLSQYDAILIPGGYSYGSYLRSGGLARASPALAALKEAAAAGKFILGISNGFQILTEAGLLPGALLPNEDLKFRCEPCDVTVVNNGTPFTRDYEAEAVLQLPIAHQQGRYYCDNETLSQLEARNQIVFRYAGRNPNGSRADIAGICNEAGNVLGMMPHPDRAVSSLLGSEDGRGIFTSLLRTWREKHDKAISQ